MKEEDYSYYAVETLQPDQMGGGDILGTLIRSIVMLVTSAIIEPSLRMSAAS